MSTDRFFVLFANCKLIKGYNRALICDVQRNVYYTIPLALYHLLENGNSKCSVEDLLKENDPEHHPIIEEYFSFLLQNELIFFAPQSLLNCFPPISDDFYFPADIMNGILEVDNIDNLLISEIAKQLSNLLCEVIEIYVKVQISMEQIKELMLIFEKCEFSVNMNIQFNPLITHASLAELIDSCPAAEWITVYNAPKDNLVWNGQGNYSLVYCCEDLSNSSHCGLVAKKFFTPNLLHFTESLHHNTCLNRKISIDTEGNIKNCPSMKESFGNIKDTTLMEALNKPGFKKYWNISKDQISVCKDCEFRHVCTDCRAYVENPDDDYSKPLKCGYDPYTCTWEDWSTHPMKQRAIEHYNMKELVTR